MKHFYVILLTLFSVLGVQAQIVNIPDANFKNALLNHFPPIDTNGDGEIQVTEAEAYMYDIYLSGIYNIVDLTGIEAFVNIQGLDVSAHNNLTDMNLSSNTSLTSLDVSNCALTQLDLNENIALETLFLTSNPITSIDLSSNVALKYLHAGSTAITNLDLSNNQVLEGLYIGSNQFSSINLTGLTSLTEINGDYGQLPSIDLTSNIALESLYLHSNQLTSLDISNNINLISVVADFNELSSIVVSGANSLEYLSVQSNLLSNIDLTNTNSLSELQIQNNQLISLNTTGATNLAFLDASNNQLTTLDINANTNLNTLLIDDNELATLNLTNTNLTDVSANNNNLVSINLDGASALGYLKLNNNQFTSFDSSNNLNLSLLQLNYNQLTSIDVSENPLNVLDVSHNQLTSLTGLSSFMIDLDCSHNQFISLDLSDLSTLGSQGVGDLNFRDNPNLEYVNFKTGNNSNLDLYLFHLNLNNLYNLRAVCIDDVNSWFAYYLQSDSPEEIVITEYCSFTPGGTYYTIEGETTLDIAADGCDSSDSFFPNLNLQITNGVEAGSFYSNNSGEYNMPIQIGNFTITPQLENTTYFTVSPSTLAVNFPADSSPFVQDFCITPDGNHDDLEVTIIPLEDARPGFDTDYKLIYKNKGTTTLSGSVDIEFDDDYMEVLTTSPTADSQTTGNLSWNYTDILPFETREILFTMTLNTPTDPSFPLNGDDVLTFTATANPLATDETPEDNVFVLDQTVVNSYDPNDKTCLEGDVITEAHVGNYVHYLIRFENTGTASAVNVVVRDVIDTSKYDLNSLIPLDSSHEMRTRIRNNNEVEFIFENIQLPFEDATNDGYVLFKIKTLPTLQVGDSFSNTAEIYFDYNAPIITNDAVTNVGENLGVDELAFSTGVNLFPNPAGTYFQIATSNGIEVLSVEIYDVTGKRLKWFNASQRYNIEGLDTGMYFVTVRSTDGEVTKKMMKR